MTDDSEGAARRYHRLRLAVAVADGGVTAATLAAWLATGAAARLAEALAGWPGGPPAVVAGVALAVGASVTLATLPLDALGGLVLPRRAGLSVQGTRAWLIDHGKAAALGGGLGLLAVEAVYALLRAAPAWWWLLAAAVLTAGLAVLGAALPVWIAPLFFRLAPLTDEGLRARLLALARRAGVPAAEVAVADLSRKGRGANAAVVGLGPTRRIVVSDTLLAGFPAEEVEAVLAHELAHHARGHLAQGLLVQAALLTAALGAAHLVLDAAARPLGLAGPADPAGLPLLGLVLGGLGLLATPAVAAWSRRVEREADGDALALADPAAFAAAIERLTRLNLAERRPGRLRHALLGTHPAPGERVARARAAAARHGAPAG
jgi:STE24 endopeptidase